MHAGNLLEKVRSSYSKIAIFTRLSALFGGEGESGR